jgi:membrane protein DedA with SNARE-associated domain
VPLARSLISIPASFRRMQFGACTLFTLLGSLVWNTVMIVAGYLLADQWEKALHYTEPFQTIVLVLVAALVVALVVRKVVHTRRDRLAAEQAHPGLADETLEEIVHDLEEQAERDPVLRHKLHDD